MFGIFSKWLEKDDAPDDLFTIGYSDDKECNVAFEDETMANTVAKDMSAEYDDYGKHYVKKSKKDDFFID